MHKADAPYVEAEPLFPQECVQFLHERRSWWDLDARLRPVLVHVWAMAFRFAADFLLSASFQALHRSQRQP